MDRDTEQDDGRADERVTRLVAEREDEQHGSGEDEQRWDHWVSPHAIGAGRRWVAAAKDKDGADIERVEEPLGEDGQREERLEFSDEEQQQRRQDSLQHQRGRRRLIARADVCQRFEEEAIAGGGEGYACAGERRADKGGRDAEPISKSNALRMSTHPPGHVVMAAWRQSRRKQGGFME